LFLAEVRGIKVLRSIELAIIAFEKGLLDKYLINRPDAKKMLIESFLWSIKLHGCAISRRELDQIVKLEID